MNLTQLEKSGYDHFMLKEIYEQPRSILDSMRGRVNAKKGTVKLGGISDYEQKMANAKRIIIVACGTSWHAGLVGEYLFEDLARVPVEVEYASEFRYRNPIITEDDIVIAISQSGETADTLAAIELAKSKGATIIGICNVVGFFDCKSNRCRVLYPCRPRNRCCIHQGIYSSGNHFDLDGLKDCPDERNHTKIQVP